MPDSVDEYTRECLTIDVGGSIRSRRVIEGLTRLMSLYGKAGVETALIDLGKAWQDGAAESFNGRSRGYGPDLVRMLRDKTHVARQRLG